VPSESVPTARASSRCQTPEQPRGRTRADAEGGAVKEGPASCRGQGVVKTCRAANSTTATVT